MATAELITATCEEPGCGGVIVYDQARSAWHHTDYRKGLDHAPRVSGDPAGRQVVQDVAGILRDDDQAYDPPHAFALIEGQPCACAARYYGGDCAHTIDLATELGLDQLSEAEARLMDGNR